MIPLKDYKNLVWAQPNPLNLSDYNTTKLLTPYMEKLELHLHRPPRINPYIEVTKDYLRAYLSQEDQTTFQQTSLPKGLYDALIDFSKGPPTPFPETKKANPEPLTYKGTPIQYNTREQVVYQLPTPEWVNEFKSLANEFDAHNLRYANHVIANDELLQQLKPLNLQILHLNPGYSRTGKMTLFGTLGTIDLYRYQDGYTLFPNVVQVGFGTYQNGYRKLHTLKSYPKPKEKYSPQLKKLISLVDEKKPNVITMSQEGFTELRAELNDLCEEAPFQMVNPHYDDAPCKRFATINDRLVGFRDDSTMTKHFVMFSWVGTANPTIYELR